MKHIACALFLRDGKILLGKRAPDRTKYPNRWNLPGGGAEEGEALEAALARESREEFGVTPLDAVPFDELPEPLPDAYGEAIYHIFRVDRWEGGEPRVADDEHVACRWFTPEEAARLDDLALPALKDVFLKIA